MTQTSRHAPDVLEVVAAVIKELGSNFKRHESDPLEAKKKILLKQVDPLERLFSK